jgi:hypothetical protein
MSTPDEHEFDESRASEFEPRPDHVTTAVLVDLVDEDAVTVLRTGFGEQTMRGSFYAVGDGDGSYGAARDEFDASHDRIGPNTYRKSAGVLAYRLDERCRVHTVIGSTCETSVVAGPGDWVVRQRTGEVMVVGPEEFARRYEPQR